MSRKKDGITKEPAVRRNIRHIIKIKYDSGKKRWRIPDFMIQKCLDMSFQGACGTMLLKGISLTDIIQLKYVKKCRDANLNEAGGTTFFKKIMIGK